MAHKNGLYKLGFMNSGSCPIFVLYTVLLMDIQEENKCAPFLCESIYSMATNAPRSDKIHMAGVGWSAGGIDN